MSVCQWESSGRKTKTKTKPEDAGKRIVLQRQCPLKEDATYSAEGGEHAGTTFRQTRSPLSAFGSSPKGGARPQMTVRVEAGVLDSEVRERKGVK